MALPMKLVFAVLATGILVRGIYDCLVNFEENGCEMTWMFEYPKYLTVPLETNIKKQYPNYNLYVYGEGEYAHQIRNMDFNGIPVLFLPGNAGSYKQVRSLGSVSLRMSEEPGINFHFNYFVADFNEELSALHGPLLEVQTEFAHICIKKILSLYKRSKHPPSSVILVGHSMGGVVARALFTLPGFDPQSVHTIITQASPHQAPVVMVDSAVDNFYHRVNDYWFHHSNTTLGHVTAVSTGGGYRDYQVRSGLTSLDNILPAERGISTTTMSVPLAWVSTDHLCSVWCRQIVLTTVHALFGIIDRKTLQPSSDVDHRAKVIKHHFLHNNGMKSLPPESKSITLDSKVSWELRSDRVWRLYEEKVAKAKYIAIPIVSMQEELRTDSVTVISNITSSNWICACRIPEGAEKCTECLSLVSKARLLPPRYSDRKFVRLNMEELGENTHIVIYIPGGSKKVEVIVDKYHMDTRHLVYELPGLYDSVISFPISVMDGTAMLQIPNNTIFYSLHLAGLASPLTAYTAVVAPVRCSPDIKPGWYEGSVMTLSVPWSNENTYHFFRYGKTGSLPIKLQSPRQMPSGDRFGFEHSEAHLEMYLHPACHYQLRLLMSPGQSAGQFVRYYGAMLPVMFVAVTLLALGGQLTAFAEGGECMWMPEAVFVFSKPFYIAPVSIVLHTITSMRVVSRMLDKLGLPASDIRELTAHNLWLQLLPILLCVSAWLVTILMGYLAHCAAVLSGRLLALLTSWVPQRTSTVAGHLLVGVAILACVCSLTLCGTLGICISYTVLLLKVVGLYCQSIRPGAGKTEKSQYHLYSLLAALYLWMLVINAPALAVWFKGLQSSVHLAMDSSRWPGVVATVCAMFFITTDSLLQKRSYAAQLRWTIYGIAVVSVPYCLVRLYRLNIVISLTVTLMAASTLPALLSRQHSKAE